VIGLRHERATSLEELDMATNPEFRKTILIGLGGAGQLILMHLKRLFLDTYGVVPPSIKLLSLDTDSTQTALASTVSAKEYSLDPEEFLHMRVVNPQEFINASADVRSWYVRPIPVGAITNGAGAVRQNGRLAFYFHMHEIRSRMSAMITALHDAQLPFRMARAQAEMEATTDFTLSQKDPEVYVCGSLAGGTGSGTFIDVGILLRHELPNVLIHGFFLLNWIYRNKAFAHRVRGNVYAALTELDNLESIVYGAPDFIPYKVRYADSEIEVNAPPYSLINLIDGRNEHGENIDNVEHLCDTVANAIFLSVGSMGYRISSVIDNLLAHINVTNPRIWGGRYARYSSLGVSSIVYPAPELHRMVSLANALDLYRAAVTEVEAEISDTARQQERIQRIKQELDTLIVQLNLSRASIRHNVCPFQSDIAFQPEKFEMADSTLLSNKQQSEEKDLLTRLQETFTRHGQQYINHAVEVFRQKIAELAAEPTLDTTYRQQWLDEAIDHFTAWSNEAARELQAATNQVNQHRGAAGNLLEIVAQSRHIPFIGGPRKSAIDNWTQTVFDLLQALKDEHALQCEQRFYHTVLDFLNNSQPTNIPTQSELANALSETGKVLRGMAANEIDSLKNLKAKPTQIIIGHGDVVVVPEELWQELRLPAARQRGILLPASITIDYTTFKRDNNIHTAEDYLRLYREAPRKLAALFRDYCLTKLESLAKITVEQAMETLGRDWGDQEKFIEEKFNHLFRLSSALWSYNRGQMTSFQTTQYDKIINIGVFEQDDGANRYDEIVTNIKAQYHLIADHAFSTTHDPHRIWLLNYAAALPVYFLSDLHVCKERYEREITPTYHIDPYFEMNVPDLFPTNDVDNIALRVLGMAIVPGIDVIHDDYLRLKGSRGHKFTCHAAPIKQRNYDEPMVWLLFRDMYADVREHPELLQILTSLLKEKVQSMPQSDLRSHIGAYIDSVKQKLATRDFSRLVSARLTYREIKELEKFLDIRGYRMDIQRYIAGN
jgi:hypothetical protein